MGKPGGFLDYQRELPDERDPLERINDWNEFYEPFSESKLAEQGARCMDCGTPFCHTGMTLSGMASGCPINNLIPEWNHLVYRGLWREALDRLHKTNNFPEFTGRVCPAPCEGSCVLSIIDPAVTIKNIERAIIDKGFEEGWVAPEPPKTRTGKSVAVVGSGPAGLACAAQLNKVGHSVTVYERADRIGGLLMYGIPNMKLEKSIVQRRVDLLKEEGITFITNTEVGKNFSVDELRNNFDAIVLCCGATSPNDFLKSAQGRDLKGIYFAMDLLHSNTQQLCDAQANGNQSLENIAAGKDVIVIGGGDTGTDCVGTALRQGCRSVTQLEIMPQPPEERAPDNPWPEWPKVYKLDYGQYEAKAQYGQDPRQYLVNTEAFLGDDQGRVSELKVHTIEWKENDGRYGPVKVEGSERKIPAQLVLLAMGFSGPEKPLPEQLGLKCHERSYIVEAEYGRFTTNVDGVFAAGDMRRGQSLVVWAINEGRAAARECDRYLMGVTTLP